MIYSTIATAGIHRHDVRHHVSIRIHLVSGHTQRMHIDQVLWAQALASELPVALTGVDCSGNETSLLECDSMESIAACGLRNSSATDGTILACATSTQSTHIQLRRNLACRPRPHALVTMKFPTSTLSCTSVCQPLYLCGYQVSVPPGQTAGSVE